MNLLFTFGTVFYILCFLTFCNFACWHMHACRNFEILLKFSFCSVHTSASAKFSQFWFLSKILFWWFLLRQIVWNCLFLIIFASFCSKQYFLGTFINTPWNCSLKRNISGANRSVMLYHSGYLKKIKNTFKIENYY